MGVRLDWQIEAERVHARVGEDPRERQRRRRQRWRVLLLTGAMFGWVSVIGALIALRLSAVDNRLRQDLIETVQAETAALRIADYAGYIGLQRSASDTWIKTQSDRFQHYQELKTTADLQLTGNVVSAVLDGPRGRAVVEETINGVPFRSVWFYWRYNDGWRHVPSDYTFWGDELTISGAHSKVNYHELDGALAQDLASRVERWWAEGCGTVGCDSSQKLTVTILPSPSVRLTWLTDQPNTLIVPSPLAGESARADQALPTPLEDDIAAQIALREFEMATGTLTPVEDTDAAWLRQSTIDWLATRFTGHGDAEHVAFIESMFTNYGASGLTLVMGALKPDSDIRVVSQALQQPLESLYLDWRSFFQWRLDVEKSLLNLGDQGRFTALWDVANPAAQQLMVQRMSRPTQATGQVQAVAIAAGSDGIPRATVQVTIDGTAQVVVFRLVEGVWKHSA